MAERFFRVLLPAGGVVTGTLVLQRPNGPAHREILRKKYWTAQGVTLEDTIAFVDGMLVDLDDGRAFGEPLTAATPGWQADIPDQYKAEIWAKYYDAQPLALADEKKSVTPSGPSSGGETIRTAPAAASRAATSPRTRSRKPAPSAPGDGLSPPTSES